MKELIFELKIESSEYLSKVNPTGANAHPGNGGTLSTVEDLFRWHRTLMTDQVLSKVALRKLYEPKLRPDETTASYYAYGWDVSRTPRNTTRIWHNGTNRIYYADFVRFVDEQTTVIMLSNKAHPNFNRICGEISKIIFNPSFQPEIPAADNEVNRAFTQSIIKTIETSGLDQAKAAYNRRKKPEQLLEFMMRNEGFNSIDNQKPGVAMQIFEMNVLFIRIPRKRCRALPRVIWRPATKKRQSFILR